MRLEDEHAVGCDGPPGQCDMTRCGEHRGYSGREDGPPRHDETLMAVTRLEVQAWKMQARRLSTEARAEEHAASELRAEVANETSKAHLAREAFLAQTHAEADVLQRLEEAWRELHLLERAAAEARNSVTEEQQERHRSSPEVLQALRQGELEAQIARVQHFWRRLSSRATKCKGSGFSALWDYPADIPNDFERDLCSPSKEPSARAVQGMIAELVDERRIREMGRSITSGRGACVQVPVVYNRWWASAGRDFSSQDPGTVRLAARDSSEEGLQGVAQKNGLRMTPGIMRHAGQKKRRSQQLALFAPFTLGDIAAVPRLVPMEGFRPRYAFITKASWSPSWNNVCRHQCIRQPGCITGEKSYRAGWSAALQSALLTKQSPSPPQSSKCSSSAACALRPDSARAGVCLTVAFRSGTGPRLLLTPPVSALSLAPASRGPELTVSSAWPFSKQRGESVVTPTPSDRARRNATLWHLLHERDLHVRTLPFARSLCVSLEQHHRCRSTQGPRQLFARAPPGRRRLCCRRAGRA
ncbi:hypothetical protein AK812_SmicGene26210 [Symbiodinium microadriaticum]|uniref:Uncharacterized protein n=1 Tax=Symbiodinium microadriaticum TaxID=2951 RepID=A0A1Q9D9Z1_SYMMI|nr:hypothetical protein AK812_SmicGene26210 [Symbiodinium microadriaticum]